MASDSISRDGHLINLAGNSMSDLIVRLCSVLRVRNMAKLYSLKLVNALNYPTTTFPDGTFLLLNSALVECAKLNQSTLVSWQLANDVGRREADQI